MNFTLLTITEIVKYGYSESCRNSVAVADGYALCKRNGIGTRTTETAKQLENIVSERMADGWYWRLEGTNYG